MSSYEVFAEFYDSLTLNVDYKARAEYMLNILKRHNHNAGLTLDLACGTGSLTIELKKRGTDIYGIDGSQEMLSEALSKSAEEGLDILFLCQKMQSIDLYGTIDTCFCTLDSVNHLTDPADVQSTFDRVSLFMNPDGLFIFDVNTVYKHEEILADNTFVYDTDEVFCVWQNTLKDNHTVDIELSLFAEENGVYYRSDESFSERAYTDDELRAMLVKAGFEVEAVYGDMSFSEPLNNEQRIIYVTRKKR